MVYMRGQARDYDEWAAITGDDSWSWNNVLPIFKRSEDNWRGSNELHGAGGEWRVEQQRLSWEILDAFAAAANEIGIPKTDDFNRGTNEGTGKFEVNQRRGVRWNTTKAFLAADHASAQFESDDRSTGEEIAPGWQARDRHRIRSWS